MCRNVIVCLQSPAVPHTRIKCPGHEVDHSAPSRAKVKNQQSHASTPLYAFTLQTWSISPALALVITYNRCVCQ